jgi:hypothetical protein
MRAHLIGGTNMSNGFFARLVAKLRRPDNAGRDLATREGGASQTDDHYQDRLFAEIVAASVVIDFGGVPSDFFQTRRRRSENNAHEAKRT